MIKLTGIFKINRRVGKMIEIVKEVSGEKNYTLIHRNNIKIMGDNSIMINENEIKRLSWFFKNIKNI